jgi:glycosyltransferase involved in cell wall biosynthesis
MSHLAKALSDKFTVLNLNHPSRAGIFDILLYLRKTDLILLNWIEDLPERRMGILQSLFFFLLFPYLKISGKKIVWTLHNKKSHSGRYWHIKSLFFRLLLNKSDIVFTHAKGGLDYIPASTPKVYIPHPVNTGKKIQVPIQSKEYDIIIWGNIAAYKGVDSFLEFLKENNVLNKYTILIAGKTVDNDLQLYLEGIQKQFQNVTIINRFIEDEELNELISKSKLILFTYHTETVLSSGALMDSLLFNAVIIGPDVGAFKDLSRDGMIYTFDSYYDLLHLIDQILSSSFVDPNMPRKIEEFIKANSWKAFSQKFYSLLNNYIR